MRLKTVGTIICLIVAVALVLAFVNKETPAIKNKPRVKRKSAYYDGVKEDPLYSRADIRISDKNYQFSSVLQGDRVEHDFFIKNDSQEMIEIDRMKSCCGFILTNYTQRIFPGKEGRISLLVFTDKFGGKEMKGTIRADLLNHKQKNFNLDLSMYVKKIASVTNHKIVLKGSASKLLEGFAHIIPEPDHPFEIIGIKAKKGLHIDYSYKKIENNGRVEFIVVVKNKQKKQRVYRDMLFVQTDSKRRPELRIRVEGHISE